jgi:hypothetical protein
MVPQGHGRVRKKAYAWFWRQKWRDRAKREHEDGNKKSGLLLIVKEWK